MTTRRMVQGRGCGRRSPTSRGKQRLATHIARLLPEHTHYVELFAGSLAVLLVKTPTDGDLMLFWRVLRDRPEDLARVVRSDAAVACRTRPGPAAPG